MTASTNHESGITDARDEMMAQIRQGANLKPVSINFFTVEIFPLKGFHEHKD